MWRLIPSPRFREWRGSLNPNSRAEVDDALAYLRQFGRDAALPYVRHRIQASRHYPDMSEVRILTEERQLRVLVSFEAGDLALVVVGGDKTESGNAWYSDAIPAADDLIDQFRNYRARRNR